MSSLNDLGLAGIQKAYEQVVNQLRALILTGRIRSGDPLPPEAEMARLFGVSRSTVREALRVLGAHGLITTERGPGGGSFVSVPDTGLLQSYLRSQLGLLVGSRIAMSDLAYVRSVYEVPAARWAAERRNQEQADRLRQLASVVPSSPREEFRLSQEFHMVVLEAAGNKLLNILSKPIYDVLATHYGDQFSSDSRALGNRRGHLDIADAIVGGDAYAAAEAMRQHLLDVKKLYDAVGATDLG